MKSSALWRYARIAPRKAQSVADVIRGKSVGQALVDLSLIPRKASRMWRKVIESAVANMVDRNSGVKVDVDSLKIAEIRADKAVCMRRFMPRAMGRATRINKLTSHLTVTVAGE